MNDSLSPRVQKIKPSPTFAIASAAAQLKAQGKNIISLGTGEPDFDTPDFIKEAAIDAIRSGFTKYTPVDGIPELKQAIIDKFQRDNGFTYSADEVLVSCGGKQSLYNLTQAVLSDGMEAIIPAPYWVSYPSMVTLAGARPIILNTDHEQHYKIAPEQLTEAINKNTRLFFLNSPSNPSGQVYSYTELTALADVLLKHPHVLIATDDMYEHIYWGNEPFVNILNVCPDLKDRCLVHNGVSKAYSMTGWRIGYAAGPNHIIAAMKKVQSQSTSNPTSISQKAAVAALNGDQTCVRDMVTEFKKRHDHVHARLNALPGVHCLPAEGTFYLFPQVQDVIDQLPDIYDDIAFSEYLLDQAEVALVPGSAFGQPGCIRLSFATSLEVIDEAIDRIMKVIR